MAPLILAIETSQRSGAIALGELADPGAGDVDVEPLSPTRRHDDDLMPAIDRVLTRAGRRAKDLDVVGLSIGPGGFTGLRVAVATAKMLALALDVDLVPVPTSEVVAESIAFDVPSALIGLAGKGPTVWIARYRRNSAGRLEPSANKGTPTDGRLEPVDTVEFGDIHDAYGDEYTRDLLAPRAIAANVRLHDASFDAAACLAVVLRRHAAGRTVSAAALRPIYAREPEAVRLWNARSENPRGATD